MKCSPVNYLMTSLRRLFDVLKLREGGRSPPPCRRTRRAPQWPCSGLGSTPFMTPRSVMTAVFCPPEEGLRKVVRVGKYFPLPAVDGIYDCLPSQKVRGHTHHSGLVVFVRCAPIQQPDGWALFSGAPHRAPLLIRLGSPSILQHLFLFRGQDLRSPWPAPIEGLLKNADGKPAND